MIWGSAKRPAVRGLLAYGLLLCVMTALCGFNESWNGIRPVASTVNGLAVPMFLLLTAALVMALMTRQDKAR